ncbi:MAG TPA: hypothetical protein PLL20_12595 [Phycisphaerae bacterium]|nr:hypothetical protein [Phycisphaerae bacterium]HRR84948.1 hypothetical protein [Phycisphaerae bacterium]
MIAEKKSKPRDGLSRRGAPNHGQSQKEEEMTVNPALTWFPVLFLAGRSRIAEPGPIPRAAPANVNNQREPPPIVSAII